eukprot:6180617-Pleurochrysis_carterae.AAC.2
MRRSYGGVSPPYHYLFLDLPLQGGKRFDWAAGLQSQFPLTFHTLSPQPGIRCDVGFSPYKIATLRQIVQRTLTLTKSRSIRFTTPCALPISTPSIYPPDPGGMWRLVLPQKHER